MKILELIAKLTLKVTGFKAGMKEAEKAANESATNIAKSFKSALAGYFGYQAFQALISRTAARALEVKYMSEQFDATTDEVQKLDKVARGAGKTFDDFGTMLIKMGAARKNAVEDSREMRETFLKYGITLEDLNNPQLRNIDLLKRMAVALKGVKLNQADRENFKEIFGKQAPKLLEVLSKFDDSKPINIIEEAQVDRIFRATKELQNLKKQYDILAAPVVGGGAGVLSSVLYNLGKPFDKNYQNMAAEVEKVRKNTTNPRARELASGFRSFSGGEEDTMRLYETIMAFHRGGGDLRGIKEAGSTNLEDRQEQLYKDKIAIGDRNDADKAELALQQAILETEVKRGGEAAKRARLQKEIAYHMNQAAPYQVAEAAGFGSDIDRQFIAEHLADAEKAKQDLRDLEIRGMEKLQVDSLQKRGQLVGGAVARASYLDSIGITGGAGASDIPSRQLAEQRKTNDKLDEIKSKSASGTF